MHYATLVLVSGEVSEEAVESLLEPYDENAYGHQEPFCWDWYRIGGRWDGYLKGDEGCPLCEKDFHHHYTDAHDQLGRNVASTFRL